MTFALVEFVQLLHGLDVNPIRPTLLIRPLRKQSPFEVLMACEFFDNSIQIEQQVE